MSGKCDALNVIVKPTQAARIFPCAVAARGPVAPLCLEGRGNVVSRASIPLAALGSLSA